jgi:hypothetical protein
LAKEIKKKSNNDFINMEVRLGEWLNEVV